MEANTLEEPGAIISLAGICYPDSGITPLIPQNAASRLVVTNPHITPFFHEIGAIIFFSLCCILNLLNSIGGLHGRQYDFWNHPTDIGNLRKGSRISKIYTCLLYTSDAA